MVLPCSHGSAVYRGGGHPADLDIKAYRDSYLAAHPGADVDEMFVYIPYNEPEQSTRYPSLNTNNATGANSRALFYADWKLVYDAIARSTRGRRSWDRTSSRTGPTSSTASFRSASRTTAFRTCSPGTCSGTRHSTSARVRELPGSRGRQRRPVENSSADREVPFPLPTDINEYAPQAEIAVGGHLIQSIARYDELKMKGALPYWNTANSYGSLLAGQNEPNGAWWLYKWYADMEGDMAKVAVVTPRAEGNTLGDGLYGLSTIDDDKKQVGIEFGGTTRQSNIVFNNVTGHARARRFSPMRRTSTSPCGVPASPV